METTQQEEKYEKLFNGIIDNSEKNLMKICANKICRVADITLQQLSGVDLRSKLEKNTEYYKKNLQKIEDAADEAIATFRFFDLGINSPVNCRVYICQEKVNNRWVKTKVGIFESLMAELKANKLSNTTTDETKNDLSQQKPITVSEDKSTTTDTDAKNENTTYDVQKNITDKGAAEQQPEQVKPEDEKVEEVEVLQKKKEEVAEAVVTNVTTDKESITETPVQSVPKENIAINENKRSTNMDTNKNSEEKNKQDQTKKQNSGINTICEVNLINEELWNRYNNKSDVIKNYLFAICSNAIETDKNIIKNSDKSMNLINCGLINKAGKSIYIVFKVAENGFITDIQKVDSKAMLLRLNFSREDAKKKLEPVKIFESYSELAFPFTTTEDFEFPDEIKVKTLTDRYNSLTENNSKINEDEFIEKIEDAITLALEINKVSINNFIIPVYAKQNKSLINYAIKLDHLYLVVKINDDNFAEIVTVTNAKSVHNTAMIINPYMTY